MRKLSSIYLVVCSFWLSAASALPAQSAREYFNELYQAGGLDRMADGHSCFYDDQKSTNFFIFGESKYVRDLLIEAGDYAKMKPSEKVQLDNGFLNVRQYSQGVPHDDELFFARDGSSWVTDEFTTKGARMRIRLSISWETFRFRKSVEIRRRGGVYEEAASSYGRCEMVSPAVRQTAQ